VKSGATVFPNLPDSFFADFTDSGPKATVALCVQAALKGTPCPGKLTVRLP
jgi:ribose transport system substrate-binding protein